jgi:dephospho-CoA kinase
MLVIGLTGSIGMGKSTTLAMFKDEGIPVHSADESVHRLYSGNAAQLIENAFPGTVDHGTVNRERLAKLVLNQPEALKRLESIVHPLVRKEEEAFLENARKSGTPFAVVDIPLLYETGGESRVDKVIVVTAPAQIQRERVLDRPGMTDEKFKAIVERQLPDAQKRKRADFVIDTGQGLGPARQAVHEIIRTLTDSANRQARNPKGDNDA